MYGRRFIRHGRQSFFGQADNAARPQSLKIDGSMPIVAEIEQIRKSWKLPCEIKSANF
jgi:hypothetical protein